MEEMKIKLALAMWQGVLDRLQYDEYRITRQLREILEKEFRFILELAFDVKNVEKLEKEVKKIINKNW
jgi:hypothetical protein